MRLEKLYHQIGNKYPTEILCFDVGNCQLILGQDILYGIVEDMML